MTSDLCPQRHLLSDEVVKATGESYRAKQEYDSAKKKQSKNLDELALVLQAARAAERAANKALADHIKEHGCYSTKKLKLF